MFVLKGGFGFGPAKIVSSCSLLPLRFLFVSLRRFECLNFLIPFNPLCYESSFHSRLDVPDYFPFCSSNIWVFFHVHL